MTLACPCCNSTEISGLYGSFWAPLDENGEDPLHLGEHEGSTELTGRCRCSECDFEFDEDDESMYWLLREMQFDQLPSGEPSILYPTGRYGSDYEHLNAKTLRFLADELERRAASVDRCREVPSEDDGDDCPKDCSGDPASCPENEGYGCWCSHEG